MSHVLIPWLRRGALAVAALAILIGVPQSSRAGSLVGVYEKSGFEYLVNLGDSSTFSSISFNANIAEFGGSTAGAQFLVVSVVNRNLTDDLGLSLGNVIYTTLANPNLSSQQITDMQGKVAGFGTADSWFDLIPSVAAGAPGSHSTVQATAGNAYEVKVGNDFFGIVPFSVAGTIDPSGNLTISLYSGVAGSDFNSPPTGPVTTRLMNLQVSSTGISKVPVPEPASVVLLGVALATGAALRRRTA
jgi:hypothetical protein